MTIGVTPFHRTERRILMRWTPLLLACACVTSRSVVCDDGSVCPEATVCDLIHHLCVSSAQLAECAGAADQTACPLPSDPGNCQDGVCLPVRCGNGRIDLGEACDDGNTGARDGCAADCRSDERCGNGQVDLATGEQCDDGNSIEHDGCSSACKPERAAWITFGASARADGVATYDAHLHAVLAFGGFAVTAGVASELAALMMWNGQWTELAVPGPEPRRDAMLAYDAANARTVLTGGFGTHAFRDTWAFDGLAWTRLPDGPLVEKACFVYDARRGKLVLLGGEDPMTDAPLATIWELDANGWTERTLAGPSARYHAACAYDPERGAIVMVGGHTAIGTANDAWQFDGTTWSPIASPGAIEHAALAFDPDRHQLVLFGGADATGTTQARTLLYANGAWTTLAAQPIAKREGALLVTTDTGLVLFGGLDGFVTPDDAWYWHGAWTQVAPGPPPRTTSCLAADPDHRRVVVFGGKGAGGTALGDTWELTPLGWQSFAPTTPTFGSAMTYDATRHTMVRFGGRTTTPINTTFVWSGTSWTPLAPATSPPARFAHGLVYDPDHRVSVLFGGTLASGFASDTWTWDGTTWTPLAPASAPPARTLAALGYDPIHHQVILYGGLDAAQTYHDTWIWDGVTWTQAVPSDGDPSGLAQPALVWNSARQRLVLVGGYDARRDQWEWDGAHWQFLPTVATPAGVTSPLAYPLLDGAGYAVLGGTTGAVLRTDAQLFTYTSDRASDACTAGIDLDGDGLAACADPDCWATCSPECPPGASCGPDLPRCGDGLCGELESCHSCPVDCAVCPSRCGDFVCNPGEQCPGDCG